MSFKMHTPEQVQSIPYSENGDGQEERRAAQLEKFLHYHCIANNLTLADFQTDIDTVLAAGTGQMWEALHPETGRTVRITRTSWSCRWQTV